MNTESLPSSPGIPQDFLNYMHDKAQEAGDNLVIFQEQRTGYTAGYKAGGIAAYRYLCPQVNESSAQSGGEEIPAEILDWIERYFNQDVHCVQCKAGAIALYRYLLNHELADLESYKLTIDMQQDEIARLESTHPPVVEDFEPWLEKEANEKYYCGGDLPDSAIYEAAAANDAYKVGFRDGVTYAAKKAKEKSPSVGESIGDSEL
jgi:hypothetical protein